MNRKIIEVTLSEQRKLVDELEYKLELISNIADVLMKCLRSGNKILVIGNGGSASDAQHFCAELIGSFYCRNRPAINAIALCTDTSAITAISNDFGYNFVFARQIQGLAKAGDVLVSISTSGNSKSIVRAQLEAARLGVKNIGLLGNSGGEALPLCDLAYVVGSNDTARIQEAHIKVIHILCHIIEEELFEN